MRVLVACEESQEVCKAFRARGHEAYSCDVQECSGGASRMAYKGRCTGIIKNALGHDYRISPLHVHDKRRSGSDEGKRRNRTGTA